MNTTSDACLVCGGTRVRAVLAQNGYRVVACARCGFQFVYPTPTVEQLADFYDRSYAVPLERDAANPARHARRLDELERWLPARGRLLEVGCSYGHGLALARERGWQVAGVELSPTASQYARAHFGLHVFSGDLLDAPFEDGSFDAAVMWHVLEHTHDPRAQLRRLHALLRPGGVLGLRVPNVRSLGARLAGRSWVWRSLPAHLWYFSAETLPRLLANCGFETLQARTARGDGWNPYQHLLAAFGSRLNDLQRAVRRRPRPAAVQHVTVSPAVSAQLGTAQRAWVALMQRAHPRTDALARATAMLVEPLEAAGLGDELICYARRAR
jgi:SAM-dependent methyltransferase